MPNRLRPSRLRCKDYRHEVLPAGKLFSWSRRTTYSLVAPCSEAVLDLGGRRKRILAWTHRRGRRGHAHRTVCVRGAAVLSRMAEPYQTLYTTCSPTHGLYTHGPVQSPSLLYKKCKRYDMFNCMEVVPGSWSITCALGAHAERFNGGARPLEANPCLPEPARTTVSPVHCRSAAEKSV